ncbi:MAG: hypothetical protein M0R28_19675 [Pigmentiphaga sp.]|nr:hypothetical protein [Pigmentiphaga sp.]
MMEILKVIVAPILVALVSWLIKDYIFTQQKAKQELLRNEWLRRLTTFWSPLFLWSGMILFPKHGDGNNLEKAVSELTAALAGNAHLLPLKHYYVIISLIEKSTVLPEKTIDLSVVNDTRSYIYRQIEILNYLLYRRDNSFDPLTNTAFVGPPLALLRAAANTTVHLLTWALLAGFLYLGYYIFNDANLVGSVIYIMVLVLPLWADAERRIEMRREAVDHRTARNKYGLLAVLRWGIKKLA